MMNLDVERLLFYTDSFIRFLFLFKIAVRHKAK